MTLKIGPEKGHHLELTWLGQVQGFVGDDSGSKRFNWSAYTGPQATWVFSFLNGMLQLDPLVQALVGATTAQSSSQPVTNITTAAAQVAAGGQIVLTFDKLNKNLSFGVQATAGVTAPAGANATFDKGMVVFAQWGF